MKLVQLDGLGKNPVIEPNDGISQWLIKSSHEEQQDHSWPQVISQVASKRMKQLELSFSKILDVETRSKSSVKSIWQEDWEDDEERGERAGKQEQEHFELGKR